VRVRAPAVRRVGRGVARAHRAERPLHRDLGLGNVRGRAHPSPPAARPRQRAKHGAVRGLPGRGDARPPAAGRSRGGEHLRRPGAAARRGGVARRLQRPRRPARARDLGGGPHPGTPARVPGARRARAGGGAGGLLDRAPPGRGAHPHPGRGVRAVELTGTRYQVGQRLRHPQFGEGLVVEVHTDRGREVLEVVFDGRLRRLSAQRDWEVVNGDAPLAHEVAPGRTRAWHPHGDRVLDSWDSGASVTPSLFDLRNEAERWAGWAGTERLISLDSLRGVERFPHQIKACFKVMRDLNGRAILADEVGLGKTIEAGIVLKEYLLRGAVRTALVLVPASLCEQWRAELWDKFELDFVVSRGAAGPWGRHPVVNPSLETARHERQ